jgi:aminomethyltransferase
MQTPLYSLHQASGGKMVDFHGWDMPLHYGSQIEEHHAVRRHAGMFDVSHMTIVDVSGAQAKPFLRYVLANDIAKSASNQAMYSCMLNDQGGVIDDLICYPLSETSFRLVVNSATKEKDLAWLKKQAGGGDVELTHQDELAILAIQGPEAMSILTQQTDHLASDLRTLKPFRCLQHREWLIARTGYTGEQGVEIMLPASQIKALWRQLLQAGVTPCGLGARDTLRLEAGLNLYGQDMDEETSPLASNLAWTVSLDDESRQFMGRTAIEQQKEAGVSEQLVGLILKDKGVLRQGQAVIIEGLGEGVITSGGFSPTLEKGIAFARVPKPKNSLDWGKTFVNIRDKLKEVRVVKLPFVRRGKAVHQPLGETQ